MTLALLTYPLPLIPNLCFVFFLKKIVKQKKHANYFFLTNDIFTFVLQKQQDIEHVRIKNHDYTPNHKKHQQPKQKNTIITL